MEAIEDVVVKVDAIVEVEEKEKVVPHLIIKILYVIVTKRKDILLITI